MHFALPIFILFGSCLRCWGVCTYPSALIGEWYSTSFGTLNFETNQSFSGFTSALSSTPLTFTCFESSGSQYVSVSSENLFDDVVFDTFLCMNLQEISTIKYYFTLDGNLDNGTGIRFYTSSSGTVTVSEACSRSDTRSAGEYELLIKKDELSNAVTACPGDLQSTFNVTMTSESVADCTGTQMEGSSGALEFNYSSCVTGLFNSGGYLQCLYSKSDGYSYVTLYNNDTTTDESSTFLFTCLTYTKDGETLRATESPNSCHLSQTPTSVDSPGVTYYMTDLLYTPDGKDYTTVIIVVCCIAAVLIIIIIIVILYFKFCRKPKPEPPPPKIKKRKKKLSITEYTPRSLGRASSVEKVDEGVINKKSTGEILTGLIADKKDKHVVQNGDAYEPPKKEAWQKKWENERNKVSPRLTQDSLKRMSQTFSSDGGISRLEELSVSDLDKAYTLSTSLPESIDIPFKDSPRQTTKTLNFDATLRNSVTPKYAERSHATPSMPASTGKFGGSPRITSNESIHMLSAEPKLGTISENPLSRENTRISQKDSTTKVLRERPNLTRLLNGGEMTSLSTVLTSNSTASVGDIRFQNLSSRSSYLSASKSSIFDDPGWLMENKKAPEGADTFQRINNLIPSIPKEKVKDPKWFMKTQKMSDIPREDIEYYKSRNKRSVGLKDVGRGSSSSQEIIAREKMQRKHKKSKKDKPKLVRPAPTHFED